MGFYSEMAAVAVELLGEVGDNSGETLGEDLVVRRKEPDGYNATTRRTSPGTSRQQTLRGTFESSLSRGTSADSLALKYERVCIAVPGAGGNTFEPRVDDRVDGDGATWRVAETAPERRQGVALLWIMGLERA